MRELAVGKIENEQYVIDSFFLNEFGCPSIYSLKGLSNMNAAYIYKQASSSLSGLSSGSSYFYGGSEDEDD